MKNWKWIAFGLMGLLVPAAASAVYGVDDFNTYQYRSYTNSARCATVDEQWTNWDDWFDEMLDITQSNESLKSTTLLSSRMVGATRSTGFNADIILVDTHGNESGSGNTHVGNIADMACSDININNAEPTNNEAEVLMWNICDIYTRINLDNWISFRNMHRFGAPVSAGCWDTCFDYEDPFSSTFNDLGDMIADSHATILNSWVDAHDWLTTDEDVIVLGLGTHGAGDCDDTANVTSFQNRASHHGPSYAHNKAFPSVSSDPELCGFYWDNL
jgi:hypothetical protein